jgi:superfamily I DNA/RNA helicase/RecB family exonuclease
MTQPKFIATQRSGLKNVAGSALASVVNSSFDGLSADAIFELYGSPGSGKTSALILRFQQLAQVVDRSQILVLAATRDSAATLRDVLALEMGGASLGPLARTVSSVAFAVVRHQALAAGLKAPELISGAEQDAIFVRLLAEHEANGDLSLWPKHIDAVTRGLKGFRAELRDLISACQELGLDSQALARLAGPSGSGGVASVSTEWAACAVLFQAYEQLLATPEYAHKYDSPSLINHAIALLESGQAGELHNFAAVLIDDAQELTPSAARFIQAIVSSSSAGLGIFADPDAATLGFRGANPALAGQLVQRVAAGRGAQVKKIVLGHTGGSRPAGINHALSRLAKQIHAEGAGAQRAGLSGDSAPLPVQVFQDPQAEIAWLALQLRQLHLLDGVAWEDIAVVGRTREVLDTLERELAAQDVPVRIVGAQSALRDEFAARELLLLAQLACANAAAPEGQRGNTVLDGATAEALLLSPYAGFDSVTMRRLRRELRQDEMAAGGNESGILRNTDDLLVELFDNLAAATTLRGPEARKLRKFLKILEVATEIAADPMQSIEDLLWHLWNASDLAGEWEHNARGVGEVAVQANRNLDAVVALFAAANRYVERNPGAPKQAFIAAQLDQAVPEDSLSFSHNARGTVSLLTPAGLVGRRFHTVAAPRLIEGVWPNLKPRSTLLGAAVLTATVEGTLTPEGLPQRTELADETRMFFKTIGAANNNVLVSSFDSEEELVSQLLAVVGGKIPETTEFKGHTLTLRGTAALRRRQLVTETDPAKRGSIAADLARLAHAGVAGAHPDDWYGLLQVSSLAPVLDLEDPKGVPMFPSQLENFVKCPLHWFLEAHGAKDADFSAGVGTIVHKALEIASKGDESTLWQEVESRWHTLRFESAWLEQAEKRKARKLVNNIASYLTAFRLSRGELVSVEFPVDLKVGNVHLMGRLDRVEKNADGSILIVDLKTGSRSITAEEAANHAQLGLYQIAYLNGAFSELVPVDPDTKLDGGKLLLVGTNDNKYEERTQASIQDDPAATQKFEQMIAEAALGMAMTEKHYVAKVSTHCSNDNEFGTCSLHMTKAVSYVG